MEESFNYNRFNHLNKILEEGKGKKRKEKGVPGS